jgi:hypothetical protein
MLPVTNRWVNPSQQHCYAVNIYLSWLYYFTCKWLIVKHATHPCVSIHVRHSDICFISSFTIINLNGEIHIWTVWFFVWYVKNNSYRLSKRMFWYKYPGVWVTASSVTFELMKCLQLALVLTTTARRATKVLCLLCHKVKTDLNNWKWLGITINSPLMVDVPWFTGEILESICNVYWL